MQVGNGFAVPMRVKERGRGWLGAAQACEQRIKAERAMVGGSDVSFHIRSCISGSIAAVFDGQHA